MVPSENAMSGLAKLPLLLDTYHRYFFNELHDPGRWHFPSGAPAADVETSVTIPLLRELARAGHVTVRPLSGLNGMLLVLAALGGPPGSTVATIAQENGGHYATEGIAGRLGQRVVTLAGPNPHELDYEGVTRVVAAHRPALVYVDQSNCLFPVDVARLVAAARAADPGVLVHVDASHWMGLILGGVFANPLECGADSFGGSTHKTFPGPQKAVFCTNRDDVADRIRQAQDYLISSHHFGAVLSLGLALAEFRDLGGAEYAGRVVANTRRFGGLLHDRGLPVVAAERGFTAGHQLWLDTEAAGLPAREAAGRLYRAGIRVNFQDLPGLPRPAVRIGLNEVTYRGLGKAEVEELSDVFAAAVTDSAPASVLAARTAALRHSVRTATSPDLTISPLRDTAVRLCLAALLDVSPEEVPDAAHAA